MIISDTNEYVDYFLIDYSLTYSIECQKIVKNAPRPASNVYFHD